MAPLNVLIVGCSIAGPTLATFLLLTSVPASEKPRVTILERAPVFRPQGQNIDVRGAGVTIIRKLGLKRAVRAATTGEEGVNFVDKDDRIWASFAADKSVKVQTPTSDIEILRGRMADLLYRRSRQVSKQVQDEGGVQESNTSSAIPWIGWSRTETRSTSTSQEAVKDVLLTSSSGPTAYRVGPGAWHGARRARRTG